MKSAAVDSEELKSRCHQILDQEKVSREHLALSPAQACGVPAEHSRTDDLLPLRKVHGDRCHTFPGHLLLPGQLVCLSWAPGQRSLVGYSPWGHKELDTTEQLDNHNSLCATLKRQTKRKLFSVNFYCWRQRTKGNKLKKKKREILLFIFSEKKVTI